MQKSNPDEVVEWLEAKGFSGAATKALRMPGHQLFGLSRSQLERVVGVEEGKRLYSQILVQRNVSGVSRHPLFVHHPGEAAHSHQAFLIFIISRIFRETVLACYVRP